MNFKHAAAAMTLVLAAPAFAQNSVANSADALGNATSNAASSVGNAAGNVAGDVGNAASNVGSAAGNAVDVNVTTDANAMGAADLNATGTDMNMDANMTDLGPANDAEMMTTTTTQRESSGKGAWGLLGLAGLLSFLFRPKKPAIHLDERKGHANNRV